MKWTELEAADCSLARALSAVGDRWTLLILRDAFLKVRRVEAFEASLGISRRTLTERLEAHPLNFPFLRLLPALWSMPSLLPVRLGQYLVQERRQSQRQ